MVIRVSPASTKPLPPTMRNKKRYILYKVLAGRMHGHDEITHAISQAALQYVGLWGHSRLNMNFMDKYFRKEEQMGIVCVSHDQVDTMKALLGHVKNIKNAPATICTQRVSGSLKKVIG